MPSAKSTIACFGATGGCVGATLACALREEHHCTALARSPEKLQAFLVDQHSVPPSALEEYLTIHQGDVKDPVAVSRVLVNPKNSDLLVDIILSGVGAYPTFQWSIRQPFPLRDPNICETAIGSIFTAISNLSAAPSRPRSTDGYNNGGSKKPLLVAISTAEASGRRGVPLSIYLLYHYLLSSPLADKKRMEGLIFGDKGSHVRDFVMMRPPFLTDGEPKGARAVNVGWEWGAEGDRERVKPPGRRIGWFMARKDLGAWVFDNVIREGGWEGRCVTLTY